MPHTFSAKRWQAKIRNAAKAGVSSVAIDFQRDVVKQLSKPGTGKVYSRSASIAGGNKRTPLDAATVSARLQRETDRVTRLRASGKRNVRRRSMRELGLHRASAPGHPPAVDTGTLRRSIQSTVSLDKRGLSDRNPRINFEPIALTQPGIGAATTQRYGKWLEDGTSRMAPRPWAGRTVREYVGARKHIKTFNAAFRVRLGATR